MFHTLPVSIRLFDAGGKPCLQNNANLPLIFYLQIMMAVASVSTMIQGLLDGAVSLSPKYSACFPFLPACPAHISQFTLTLAPSSRRFGASAWSWENAMASTEVNAS